jgi:hypothetical protein
MERIKIKLDNKFYNKKSVERTIKDFEEICEGKILNDEIEIEITPKEKIENLEGEFCNYVLGIQRGEE